MKLLRDSYNAIGGPWLLDRLQLVLIGGLVVVWFSVALPDGYTWDSYVFSFLRNIALFGILLGICEAANKSIFAQTRVKPANPLYVLGFGALLGSVGYVSRMAIGYLSPIEQTSFDLGGLGVIALIGAFGIPALSTAERLRRLSRIRRRISLEQKAQSIGGNDLLEQLGSIFDDLSKNIALKFEELRQSQGMTSRASLERVITECIKPLSNALASLTQPTSNYFVIRGTSSEAYFVRPFHFPIATSIIYSAFLVIINALLGDFSLSLIPAMINCLVLSVALLIAKELWEKLGKGKGVLAIVIASSIVAFPVTAVNQFFLLGGTDPVRFLAGCLLNFAVLVAIIMFTASTLFSAKTETDEYSRLLNAHEGGALGRAFRALIYRRLSQKLHGAVQSDVLALQLSLDESVLSASGELEKTVLEFISKAKIEFLEETQSPLSERFRQLTEMWSFVANIKVSNSCENLTVLQENVCFMVIQEAITNSIRHGSADQIEVQLSSEERGAFQISVVDNGTGPLKRSSRLGSGLKVLSTLTEDNYALVFNENGGASLRATVYS